MVLLESFTCLCCGHPTWADVGGLGPDRTTERPVSNRLSSPCLCLCLSICRVFFLFVCLSACLSVVHPSHHHPPIPLSIPAAAAAPWFTPGCEGFAAGTGRDRRRQRGREGEEKAGRGKRRRKDEGGGRLRSVDSVSLRIRTEPKT